MTTSPNLANESERRSAQNRAYAAAALESLDPTDPKLAWLFPSGKRRPQQPCGTRHSSIVANAVSAANAGAVWSRCGPV
jgi:hypothetical protein